MGRRVTLTSLLTAGLTAAFFIATLPSCSKKSREETVVSSVSLSSSSLALTAGQSRQLTATVLPAQAAGARLTWSSTNPYRVSVSADGLVTALSQGTAYVVARADNGVRGSCLVTVSESTAYTITISGPEGPLNDAVWSYPGSILSLSASSDDEKKHTWSWSSSEPTAAGVKDGTVTFGMGTQEGGSTYAWYGESLIKVISEDGVGAFVKAVTSISEQFLASHVRAVFGSTVLVAVEAGLTITLQYYDGNNLANIPETAYTLSVADPSLVTVSGKKLVAGNKSGQTVVSACFSDVVFPLCTLSVEANPDMNGNFESYPEEETNWR